MTMTGPEPSRRIEWIDLARGVALIAMAIYHFSWDLEFFGYLEPGTSGTGPLKWFARAIASSFLFLVGISLVLAHGRGIRWSGFAKRLAIVVAAALAITVATRIFTPDAFVFFGILHHIAFASVLGLAFLRLPSAILAVVAVVWFSVAFWGKSPVFAEPILTWLGLSPFPPRSNDFVPVFPWFAAVLAGLACGRVIAGSGAIHVLRSHPPAANAITGILRYLGRHSLTTYLVHQPVLIGFVYLFSLVAPPAFTAPEELFVNSCVRACVAGNPDGTCETFCNCALSGLKEKRLFEAVFTGEIAQDTDPRVAEVSDRCSFEANADDN